MTRAIRWRIMTLQMVVLAVFGMLAGMAFWASSFIEGNVHDQLAAQQIYFPAKGSPSLSPSEYPDLQQYAGQQVVDGPQAKAYADGFILRHLNTIGGGKTYSQLSAESQANPSDTKLAATVQTMFRGTALRGMLLNAYGWWEVGLYAGYAAWGLTLATLVVLGTLVFEIVVAVRRPDRQVSRGEATKVRPALQA